MEVHTVVFVCSTFHCTGNYIQLLSLYGWIYAFYDYRPPKPFSEAQFVGLKWFKSLVENDIKIKQIVQVLKNTFAMSALTLGTSWLPMLFAVFLNEIRCVKFRKFVQTVTTLPTSSAGFLYIQLHSACLTVQVWQIHC